MKFASKIALFLYASVFAISFCFAGGGPKGDVKHNWGTSQLEPQQPQESRVTQGKSTSYGEIRLKHNQHVVAYLPKDVRSYQPLAFRCNVQGQRAENDISGGCLDYVSASTHTKWRVRFVQPGTGERIYQIKENEHLILHVQFDASDVNKVIFASAEASKYADANGAGATQVAREGSSQTQAPPQQQARADCGRFGFAQRIACEAANNAGLGAAIGAGVRALGK